MGFVSVEREVKMYIGCDKCEKVEGLELEGVVGDEDWEDRENHAREALEAGWVVITQAWYRRGERGEQVEEIDNHYICDRCSKEREGEYIVLLKTPLRKGKQT